MTDHNPSPEWSPPGTLVLRTAGACEFGLEHLLQVFGEQRARFVAVLRGFGPADWAAPTRCAEWSAHDVVRHLCDCNALVAGAGPGDRRLDITAGFDPRFSPRLWSLAPADESAAATLHRFTSTTAHLLDRLRSWLADERRFDVRLPYGLMDWRVLALHAYWDSWIHERDVLLARSREHPTCGDATFYATAYGVFIAAAVAPLFGDQVQGKLTLGGDGGGIFEVASQSAVTLTVRRMAIDGPLAAEVTDALAGRGPEPAEIAGLPASSHAALLHMAEFFNTQVQGNEPSVIAQQTPAESGGRHGSWPAGHWNQAGDRLQRGAGND